MTILQITVSKSVDTQEQLPLAQVVHQIVEVTSLTLYLLSLVQDWKEFGSELG